MIKVDKLTKLYNDQEKTFTVIKNVTFDVKKGEIVCVVGPSGSGKSTILKCLTGIDREYYGTIKIQGKDSFSYLKQNRIALVSQKYSNFPWLSVYENIAIGFYGKNMSQLKINELTSKLLKRVGLFKVKNDYINKLSGGMQQRVAIARAIAQQTDIIAFDEPFGALDIQTRTQMQEFLVKLWEEEQKTMILVTHDIDEAIYLADRIFVLGTNPGTIKEVVEVNIKKPRKPEIRFQENFIKLKKYISYIIRSESIKANLEEGVITDRNILKMGLYIWPGNTPLYYAKDSGLFMQESLNIEQINFDDNKEKVRLWTEEKLEIINVTLEKAIELHSKMPDFKILEVLNRSIDGDALIVKESINSVSELKGKTIGLEKGSVAEFFLFYILDKHKMSSKDVKIRDMKCGEIGAKIISGEIDSGVLWEPWLDKTLELSSMKILKSTKDYPILYDVLIVKDKLLRRKDLKKISKIWKQSVLKFKKQKNDIIGIASSHIGIPERELAGFLEKIEFFQKTPENIFDRVRDIEKVLIKEKIVKKHCEREKLWV